MNKKKDTFKNVMSIIIMNYLRIKYILVHKTLTESEDFVVRLYGTHIYDSFMSLQKMFSNKSIQSFLENTPMVMTGNEVTFF